MSRGRPVDQAGDAAVCAGDERGCRGFKPGACPGDCQRPSVHVALEPSSAASRRLVCIPFHPLCVLSCLVVSNSLRPHGLRSARFLCPWDASGKCPGIGCHFCLQGIFPTQGLNPHLLHWQADSLPRGHLGSPSHPLQLPKAHSHISNCS